tara:strand:+ start:378 stop:776 length:399 start_codon:yes stop_codon:yes gene_type:complete
MIRLILSLTAFISLPTAGSDIALLDCYSDPDIGDDFLFMQLDWDKSAEAADVVFYDRTGMPKAAYTNVPVRSSAKTINFQSTFWESDQRIKIQVHRVTMGFAAGISYNNTDVILVNVDGSCRIAERQLEQAF